MALDRAPPLTAVVVVAIVLSLAPGTVSAAGRSTNNFKFNSRAGHPADLRRLVANARRQLQHALRLPESQLGRGARRSRSGPSNSIEPGGPDRGQPTFFYTRTNRNLFTVNVPKDFGQKEEMVWTVIANGKTQKAIGWLQPEWEIDPAGGAASGGQHRPERGGEQAADRDD